MRHPPTRKATARPEAAFPDLQQAGFVDLSASYPTPSPPSAARASDAWATWSKIMTTHFIQAPRLSKQT